MTVFQYIHAHQVRAYERAGWTCSRMAGHHGANGYWLASRTS